MGIKFKFLLLIDFNTVSKLIMILVFLANYFNGELIVLSVGRYLVYGGYIYHRFIWRGPSFPSPSRLPSFPPPNHSPSHRSALTDRPSVHAKVSTWSLVYWSARLRTHFFSAILFNISPVMLFFYSYGTVKHEDDLWIIFHLTWEG